MSNVKEPKLYLILRILGFTLLVIGICMIVAGIIVGQDIDPFESSLDMALIFPGVFIVMGGISCTVIGFEPKMAMMSARKARYIQEMTKGDLKAVADTQADISIEAVSRTAKAIKDGIDDKVADTMFCKHCGETIDQDSKFCKHCGKEL
jgi:hypothetical protein